MREAVASGPDMSAHARVVAVMLMLVFLMQGSSMLVVHPLRRLLLHFGLFIGPQTAVDIFSSSAVFFLGLLSCGYLDALILIFLPRRSCFGFGPSGLFIFLLSGFLAISTSFWQTVAFGWDGGSLMGWQFLNLFLFWYLACVMSVCVAERESPSGVAGRSSAVLSSTLGRVMVQITAGSSHAGNAKDELVSLTRSAPGISALFLLSVAAPAMLSSHTLGGYGLAIAQSGSWLEYPLLLFAYLCGVVSYWALAIPLLRSRGRLTVA